MRGTMARLTAVTASLAVLAGCSETKPVLTTHPPLPSQQTAAPSPLSFPKDTYTTETTTVATADGKKKVTYRLYAAIPYVTKPLDAAYQSLTIKVPLTVDGQEIKAAGAPILFNVPVGGYLAARVEGAATPSGNANGQSSHPSGQPGHPSGAPSAGQPSGLPGQSSGEPGQPSGEPGQSSGQPGQPSGEPGHPSGEPGLPNQPSSGNADAALAAGYVVVTPGVRGRDNEKNGSYVGKAPSAIVDLKAAVRYLHYNEGVVPGDTDRIIVTGTSAGGALAALLGASAGSGMYEDALAAIGAADASDSVFAVAAYCPITDLEHADGAYEWAFGASPLEGQPVDQALSQQLAQQFATYQTSLKLVGLDDFGRVDGKNLDDYLRTTFLQPAASTYLRALSASKRSAYLRKNPWIEWRGKKARFTWEDFVAHVGRSKSLPAFDAFDLSSAENSEFGNGSTDARHFTLFSAKHDTSGNKAIASPVTIQMMNPMHFLMQKNPDRAKHWFLRAGTKDTDTSPAVLANLATAAANLGDAVDAQFYWDAGHGANEDPQAFMAWLADVAS